MKQPNSTFQLQKLLADNGIDSTGWGQGKHKSLNHLWQEIQEGESVLKENPLRRVTAFVQVIIRQGDKVLIEAAQELANGAVRERKRPLSEKMQLGETVETTALRGIHQELNASKEQVTGIAVDSPAKTAEAPSPSYPGLITRYTIYTVEAAITGLPKEDFSTAEKSPTDPVRKHFWRWLPKEEAEELLL